MKNYILSAVLLVTFFSLNNVLQGGNTQSAPAARWKFLPETAAEVNGIKITRGELIDYIKQTGRASDVYMLKGKKLEIYTYEMLEHLINQIILAQIAASDGYVPGFKLIKSETEKILAEMPEKEKKRFMDNLASQKMNLDDFCRRKAGNMLESRQFAIDTWVEQKIRKDVKVSEQDIKDYYDKAADVVSASQILIKPRGNSPEAKKEAKKKAEQMLARIRNGEDFRKLAATESNCGSNANGLAGSIGEFARGQMVQEFEDAAFALPEGGLSDVVETQFGYHIIRIDKKSKRPLPPIEQIKGKIAEDLKNIKAQDIVIGKLNEAKKQWKITISKPLKMTDK